MSIAYIPVRQTVVNGSGRPYGAATRTFYRAGTTTLATVYADSDRNEPLTNPQVANSAGRFDAAYLDPEYDYRVVLKDASGNTLADDDYVPSTVPVSTRQIGQAFYPQQAWETSVTAYEYPLGNIRRYGAKGDGSDDTAAIQAAIDAIAVNGGTVEIPPGEYAVLQARMASNVHLRGYGATLTKLPGSAGSDNNAINAYGTVGAGSATAANVTAGDRTFDVANGALFAAGSWCLLRDNTWATSGVSGRNQELVRIDSVVSNTITLKGPTLGSYATASSAELVNITPIENWSIAGVTVEIPIGAGTGGGINTDVCADFAIRDCRINNPNDRPAIHILRSYNGEVCGNTVKDGQGVVLTGYGCAYVIGESSHHIRVTRNHQENVRESYATNRARQIVFAHNTASDCSQAHFRTMGEWCDGIVINGNACSNVLSGYSVGVGGHSKGDSNILINSNQVFNATSSAIFATAPSGKENNGITIVGNHVQSFSLVTGASAGVYCSLSKRLNITGNTINNNNLGNSGEGIRLNTVTDAVVGGNFIFDIAVGYGVTLSSCTNTVVTANVFNDISNNNVRTIGTNVGCAVTRNWADDTSNSIDATTVAEHNTFQTFTGSATYDPASLVDGAGVTTTVTCTGAALGGFAEATFSLDLQGITLTAWVSAANTVSVRFQNESGGTLDLASGTLRVRVRNALGAF